MKELRDILNAVFLNLPAKPFFAAKKTESERLRGLIQALAPVQTQKPLIRLGPKDDGGYLVPDDLEGITTCFSPGVSTVSDFELDCANRSMDVFMADASVDAPAASHERFNFIQKFIGSYTHEEFITMEDWIESSNIDQDGDCIYQIDIEGAEYEVILNIPERYLKKARIIVLEFHKLDHLYDHAFFGIAERVFGKLLKHHSCVHIHPNNSGGVVRAGDLRIPKIMEFTFYRRDKKNSDQAVVNFPNTLDADCVPQNPKLTLPACWHH